MNRPLRHLLRFLALAGLVAALPLPAHADQQDVAAAARGVVRVVIIATNGQDAYFVGHGSGFAVTPDKVITNAHVVELLRTEKNLVVGIIPSAGTRSYGGKVIAYSPGNDLALIQLTSGRLPVTTFFTGPATDGQHVTAIGYPAAVDRAQGLDLAEMVQPLSPVKTSGTVSTGRASHGFDTILHTAPMAAGNSGGPLVDDCGRVLGVNSFGSQSESDADAEFGFAVSNREVASFLRQARVQFQRTAVPCRSIAELDAAEAKRQQEEMARRQQQEQAATEARDRALMQAREDAQQQVFASRENAMAIAGILLLLSGLSFGAAMMFNAEHKRRQRLWSLVGGGVLLAGAAAAYLLRPSFTSIEEKIALPADNTSAAAEPSANAVGDNICRIDESRSRITVSETDDVHLNWRPGGCVDGDTQYVEDNGRWTRVAVPGGDASISISSFDPETGLYRIERYLPEDDLLNQARTLRGHFTGTGCTSDPGALGKLTQIQSDVRAILPPQPNERLVYQCRREKALEQQS